MINNTVSKNHRSYQIQMNINKRDRILEAATKIIAENGYQYATISEIAKEAGMSTGLIYSYFTNKLDVLFSIVEIFLQNVNDLNNISLSRLTDPVEKLYAVLTNFEALLIRDQSALYRVKVINEALPHIVLKKDNKLKKKRKQIISEFVKIINAIDSILEEGQKHGAFDDSLKPAVMRQVLFGTIGRIIYGLFFRSFSGEEVGYDSDDGHKAIVMMIEKFIRK